MSYPINYIKAVLFDMDGTLVDSERLTEQALRSLLPERGIALEGLDGAISWCDVGQDR